MICLHCQKEVADNPSVDRRPHCGVLIDSTGLLSRPLAPIRLRKKLFFAALLSPPLLTLLVAHSKYSIVSTPWNQWDETGSFIAGIYSAAVGGTICGIMLGLQCDTLVARILISIVMSALMFGVCLVLCCFGCAIGSQR